MVVKTTYDKINISFCVEQNKVSVLAEHLPKMPTHHGKCTMTLV